MDEIKEREMKVLTIGWGSVFLLILAMNIYIWKSYWNTPFSKGRTIKLGSYLFIHLTLTFLSIIYFYLFFEGKTKGNLVKLLSYISGFYISFLTYSSILFLLHDFVKFSSRIIAYPYALRNFMNNLFFGGLFIFSLAAFFSIYSLYNSKNIDLVSYDLTMEKKDSDLDELKLVYLSDLHLGSSVNIDNIEDLIAQVNNQDADLIFLGGDSFDEGTVEEEKSLLAKALSGMESNYGIFSVEGNHEYKSGDCNIDHQMNYLEKAGIHVLKDEVYRLDESLYIIGRKDAMGDISPLEDLLAEADTSLPVIVLDHRPTFKELEENSTRVDLQISGHTHSGQYLPMQIFESLIAKLTKSYVYGHHKLGGSHHIVGGGAGNWAIPGRFGSKREIVTVKINFI